jgi:hypothetical protein
LQLAARPLGDCDHDEQSARHDLDGPLGRSAEPQVRSVQGQHDQQPENDRETHPADQVRPELAGRPGPPQKHDGGGEKPRVERGDHR